MSKVSGRPTIYTDELGERICELIATHPVGIRALIRMYPDLPAADTINNWRFKNSVFSERYMEAKRFQAELLAEECIDIADDSSRDMKLSKDGDEICDIEFVQRAKLRIDTRKWMATKLAPKIYNKPDADEQSSQNSVLEKILNGDITIKKND
jgi:hypothetical protein